MQGHLWLPDVRDFIELNTRTIGTPLGPVQFHVYTKQLDYHDAGVQASFVDLHTALAASDKIEHIESWYLSFQAFLQASPAAYTGRLDSAGRLLTADEFYPAVKTFLEFEPVAGVRVNQRWANDGALQQPILECCRSWN